MEKYYVAAINAVNLLGAQRTRRLIEFFRGAEKAWRAEQSLLEKSGLPPKAFEAFLEFRHQNPDAPQILAEFCANKKVGLCSFFDEDYPPLLKEIDAPPPVFYYKGNLQTFAERIAIVGTRHSTNYGERVTKKISGELAEVGFTIVSGAAFGIDTYAHRSAVKFGRTVAVLGHGISQIPGEKKKLMAEIAERGGLVMTEFSPNFHANAGTFPTRNRIIAGLSRGVIVVEAGTKSGALITSSYAGEYGRDVFAVPGGIFSEKSDGCNALIRDGAILIRSAQDVLEFYNLAEKKKPANIEPVELTGAEKKIFDLIPAGDYIEPDDILNQLDELETNEISQIILQLEMKNLIINNGDRYTRT